MHLVAIGGSDAGISAALRARELDPSVEVSVIVADAYPNFSICGIPYYVSGEVTHWRNLAHRTVADLEATGMQLHLDTFARRIDVEAHKLARRAARRVRGPLVLRRAGRRAPVPSRSGRPSTGCPVPTPSGPTTASTCCTPWATRSPSCGPSRSAHRGRAVIVGAGYIGLEMAEALVAAACR